MLGAWKGLHRWDSTNYITTFTSRAIASLSVSAMPRKSAPSQPGSDRRSQNAASLGLGFATRCISIAAMVGAFAQSRHCLASAVAVFLSMLVGCFASRACAADGADAPPPAVLIVHSNQRPTPAAVVIEDTLRGTIPAQLRRPVEVYSEYLDVEIPASATLVADQIAFLAHKYESRNVRAIVASAAGAVPFALRLREQMASAVPIVHIAVPLDALPAMALPANVVGKPVDLDPTATIKLALQLHPGVSRVVVVLGATERDRAWERRIREAAARIVEAPDFEYIAGLPTDRHPASPGSADFRYRRVHAGLLHRRRWRDGHASSLR